MSRARVHNFAISLDGSGTGEGHTQGAPFGHAGHRLHEWMLATQFGTSRPASPAEAAGIDDAFAQQFAPGIGAEIMGAEQVRPARMARRSRLGRAGGAPTRRSTPRPSFSPISRARRSRWRAGRRSTSSTHLPPRRSRSPAKRQTVRTHGSAEAPRLSTSSLPPGSSTTCTSWSYRSCSGEAYGSRTDWRASRRTIGSRTTSSPSGVTHMTFTRTGV